MAELVLVKHSLPEVVPDLPACRWFLSDEGRWRCRPLADRLRRHRLDLFVTSTEPKAAETGQIVAGLLDKPCETAQDLHEHDRRGVPFESQKRFEEAVAGFFAQPGRLVFGRETADRAHRRFSRAIAEVTERYLDQNVAVVAHGTVITLLVARAVGLEPFPFWQRLGLPSFVVLSVPEFSLLDVVESV